MTLTFGHHFVEDPPQLVDGDLAVLRHKSTSISVSHGSANSKTLIMCHGDCSHFPPAGQTDCETDRPHRLRQFQSENREGESHLVTTGSDTKTT